MKVREYSIGYDGHGLVAELETLGGLYRIHSVMIPEAAGRDGTGSIALQRRDSDDFQAVQEWETHPRVANRFNYLVSTLEQPDDDMILDNAQGVADLADLITKAIDLAATAAQIHWGIAPAVKTVNYRRMIVGLGRYPHERLNVTAPAKKQGTRMIKVVCPNCGCTLRMTA